MGEKLEGQRAFPYWWLFLIIFLGGRGPRGPVLYLGGQGPRASRLPVLELLCGALGDASAEQAKQEQHAHPQADHGQDVVLRGGGHHLHGQVREPLCWGHLGAGGEQRGGMRATRC